MSRHTSFAENTLENYDFDVMMSYHVIAVISKRFRALVCEAEHYYYQSPYQRPLGFLGAQWEERSTGSHLKLDVDNGPSSVDSHTCEQGGF